MFTKRLTVNKNNRFNGGDNRKTAQEVKVFFSVLHLIFFFLIFLGKILAAAVAAAARPPQRHTSSWSYRLSEEL